MLFSYEKGSFSFNNNQACSRRRFVKGLALLLAAGTICLPGVACATPEKRKVLIVYFSKTGNTRTVARWIQSAVGGDMLELKIEGGYPADHDGTVRQAEKERADNVRPQIATIFPPAMDDYDTIFVGYPVWAYTMPMALYSFFDRFKFAGKTIAPFSTHLGSGLADGPEQIALLCPQAKVLQGLAIRGSNAAASQEVVTHWVRELKI